MYLILLHLALLSTTIFFITDSSFNFSHNSYQQMMHVVEGVPEICGEDSLTVLVSRNWYGDAGTGDHLTVNCSRTMSQIGDIQGIFMVDSSLNLRGYGEVRDGFYVMKPFSSPNILTTDDLNLLSRGEVPRFNQHESHITVHFPLSDRKILLTVVPSGENRLTESEYPFWSGRKINGVMCAGAENTTELRMLRPVADDIYDLFYLSGDVTRYSNGVFHLEMWPDRPAFSSVESYELYREHGTVPIYSFRLHPDIEDWTELGLPAEPWLFSDGENFYLTDTQYIIRNTTSYMRNQPRTDLYFAPYRSCLSAGETPRLIIRPDDSVFPSLRSTLISMIDAAQTGPVPGSILIQLTRETEPEFFCNCTMELSDLQWTVSPVNPEIFNVTGNLSFTNCGRPHLEINGVSCPEVYLNPSVFGRQFNRNNTAVFTHPERPDLFLLLYLPSLATRYGSFNSLIPGLLEKSSQKLELSGMLCEVKPENCDLKELGEIVLF